MKELWTEKYRPKTISEYVFKDQKQRSQIEKWIKDGVLPHLLLSGVQGTGKTTIAKVLLNELNVDSYDIKEINASKDNGVDFIRDTVTRFAETIPMGDFKYILLDEADFLSPNAQAVLRNTMERYASTVRFVLTANYPHKILPAIHSRCQGFHIEQLDRDEYTIRVATILAEENVSFDLDVLDTFVNVSYPDLRKCINLVSQNCYDGKLNPPDADNAATDDYKLNMVALFKEKRYTDARKLICSQIGQEEFEDVFRFMYQNLAFWADTEEKENKCIVTIRDGLVKHTMCADSELNLSATLVELELVAKGLL